MTLRELVEAYDAAMVEYLAARDALDKASAKVNDLHAAHAKLAREYTSRSLLKPAPVSHGVEA